MIKTIWILSRNTTVISLKAFVQEAVRSKLAIDTTFIGVELKQNELSYLLPGVILSRGQLIFS